MKGIKKITLLTKEEYEKNKNIIPIVDCNWWLANRWISGVEGTPIRDIYTCGNPYSRTKVSFYAVTNKKIGVRPVILTTDNKFKIGEKIKLFEITWTVIEPNKLLCDEILVQMPYKKIWNWNDGDITWEKSDVKKFLEKWLKNRE